MHDEVLTPERILDAAEEVLRRFGPAKTTVVDVATVLGVSHGSVYRHFPSKAALQDAVAARWLATLVEPLAVVLHENSPAPQRLRRWLELLIQTKRARAYDDPELFATYLKLAVEMEARNVIKEHIASLVAQLTQIIAEGVAQGEFTVENPALASRAVFDATYRFHNPLHAAEWKDPAIESSFEAVWSLILNGLRVR